MARMVVMVEGTVIDGIAYKRGTIVNVPSSVVDLKAFAPVPIGAATSPLHTIPRLRNTETTTGAGFVSLATTPPYIPVQTADRLGLQQTAGTFPPGSGTPWNPANVIHEPVMPVENGQYD